MNQVLNMIIMKIDYGKKLEVVKPFLQFQILNKCVLV